MLTIFDVKLSQFSPTYGGKIIPVRAKDSRDALEKVFQFLQEQSDEVKLESLLGFYLSVLVYRRIVYVKRQENSYWRRLLGRHSKIIREYYTLKMRKSVRIIVGANGFLEISNLEIKWTKSPIEKDYIESGEDILESSLEELERYDLW